MAVTLYQQLAPYYDLLVDRNFEKESVFLHQLLSENKQIKSILDLGCGTGMHMKYLQELGYSTCGLDSSHEMLKLSKKNSPSSQCIYGDFRHIKTTHKLDSAVFLGTSFNYLLTDTEFLSFRDSLHKAIKNLVVLDTRNFENKENIRNIYNDHLVYENDEVVFNSIRNVYFKDGFRFMKFYHKVTYKGTDVVEEYYDESIGRLYTFDKISSLMKDKFELVKAFGDYNLKQRFSKSSDRLIAIYKKI